MFVVVQDPELTCVDLGIGIRHDHSDLCGS